MATDCNSVDDVVFSQQQEVINSICFLIDSLWLVQLSVFELAARESSLLCVLLYLGLVDCFYQIWAAIKISLAG